MHDRRMHLAGRLAQQCRAGFGCRLPAIVLRRICHLLICLFLLVPGIAAGQSITINKEALQLGDTLIVSASGPSPDNSLTCRLYFLRMSTGCLGEHLITEDFIDPSRPFTPVSIVMWDHKMMDEGGQPPVGSDAIVAEKYLYIINDLLVPVADLIDVSKPQLKSGELFTVRAPSNEEVGHPFALEMYRLAGTTSDGSPILPERVRFDVREELDDSRHSFVAAAPAYPGDYEIRARLGGDYVIARVPITVELSLPQLEFDAEPAYTLPPDGWFEVAPVFDPGPSPDTAANTVNWAGVTTELQRQAPDGRWIDTGRVAGNVLERREFWRGEMEGTLRLTPKRAGRHRLVAYSNFYQDYHGLEIGSAEFDVSFDPVPDQPFPEITFSPPAVFNTSGVYRSGNDIRVEFNDAFASYQRVDAELHLREFGDRNTVRADRQYQPETEAIQSWVTGGGGRADLPADLPPGDYELFVRAMVTINGELFPSYVSSERFTVLPPPGDFAITVNGGADALLGAGFDVALDLPELLQGGDPWLGVEIHKAAGTYFGKAPGRGFRVWEGPVSDGRVFVGDEQTGLNQIFDTGMFEARLVFGRSRSGQKAILASKQFSVTTLPMPGALQPVAPTTDEEPLLVSVNLPDVFQQVQRSDMGWNDLSIELWRKGDVLTSGVSRSAFYYSEQILRDTSAVNFQEVRPGFYELRLVQTPRCLLDLCPHILLDRMDVEIADSLWRGAAAPDPAPDDLEDLSRGPYFVAFEPAGQDQTAPVETAPSYQPPPYLAVEVASFPRQPRPGAPLLTGVRVENTSTRSAAAVVADITLADPRIEGAPEALRSLTPFCDAIGGGVFRCRLGDMHPGDVTDMEFAAVTPNAGFVIWTAELVSAGDLGGETEPGGMLGQRAPPQIVDVVVLHDQGAVEDSVPYHPYPFGPNNRGSQSRYLLVVGHNLPQHPGAGLKLESTDTIHYGFLSYPETDNQFYRGWVDKGWRLFYDLEETDAARARAREDGYDAILIRADLKEGILPARQMVSLSDNRKQSAQGNWDLEFGDIEAQTSFVRLTDDGGFDLVTEAYLPERIHLAVETNMRLPVESIPVVIDAGNLAGSANLITMNAVRSDRLGGRLYLTGPIDLHDQRNRASLTGGTAVPVRPDPVSPPLIEAYIDPGFMQKNLRVPVSPVVASAAVRLSPAEGDNSWVWYDALSRAAACRDDIEVENWASLTLAQSEDIWNLMILDNSDHFPNQSVTFGHHAAAILLRDLFVNEMKARGRTLEWVRGNDRAVAALLSAMKPLAWRDNIALLRMEITDFDGGDLPFRYAIMNDIGWLAEQNGTTEEAIKTWQKRETVAAIDAMLEAMATTLERAEDAGDCEVEELILLTGAGFEAVGERLKSRLMTLSEVVQPNGARELLWTPDSNARFWVDQVAPLAAAVRAQQQASQNDTNLTLAIASLVSVPLGLAGSATIETLILIFEALELGYTIYDAYSQVADSDAEIEFASGAAVVIGHDRYQSAVENAQTWVSVGLGVYTSVHGMAGSLSGTLPKMVRLRQAARGRLIAQSLPSARAISSLRAADFQDFRAFAIGAFAKSSVDGADSLTSLERRAVTLVEEFRDTHPVARMSSEPNANIRRMAPGLNPTEPVRFDVQPSDTGAEDIARVRPPESGRIENPSVAGEVPNAPEARLPEGVSVRFTRAETDVEIEVPLGRFIGNGATSEVLAHAEFPDSRAVRITYLKENSPAAQADLFGDDVLRTKIQSEHIRPVEIYADHPVSSGEFAGRSISRVSEVEQLQGTAWQRVRDQGGELRIAQMMAYDGALNDLNSKGYVWLDNKGNNFDFVPLEDGSGRVQVVVMDPGGIYQIRAGAGAAFDLTDAQLARRIQLRINGTFETQLPDYAYIGTPKFRTAIRHDTLVQEFGDVFDFDAMNIPPRPENLRFNARAGEDYPDIGRLFEAQDDP